MRIKDYIFLASKNLSTRRNVSTNILLLTVAMIIFIISLSYTSCFLSGMDKAINKNISYRSIVAMDYGDISMEEMTEKLCNIDNVIKVVPLTNFLTGINIKKIGVHDYNDAGISIQGAANDVQPNIINGRGFNENENGVCIIPEKFYPYDYDEFSPEKIIDGNQLIGQKIEAEYYSHDNRPLSPIVCKTFKKEFTIIGVYNQEDNMEDYSYCYVSFDDIDAINKDIKENNIYSEKTILLESKGLVAIVDKAENVEKVLNDIQSLNCRAIIKSVANTDLMNVIKTICLIVFEIIIVIALINIIISSIKSIIDRKYDIGMQKAIGYKNKHIQGILFTENNIIGVLSYVIAIMVALVLNFIVRKYFVNNDIQLHLIGLNLDIITCIIAFVISIIIPTISSALSSVLTLKSTPVTLNKER